MTNKRTEFLSRLLRISELNEQLMQISDRGNKQPAYAKKIKLVQMNPCSINFQEPRNNSCNPEKGTGKVMIINRPNLNYNLISSYRSETILIQEELQRNHISPVKMQGQQSKCLVERKRVSMNVEAEVEETEMQIQMSNSVACEGRYPPNRSEDIYRQRLKYKQSSLGKRNYYERKGEQSTKAIQQQSAFNAEITCIPVKSISNMEQKKETALEVKGEKEPKYFRSLNHISQFSNQKQIEEDKRAKLSLIKEINKNYAKPFVPPPKITAKSYIICETKDNEENLRVVVSYNSKNSQEVASLTKIMTCILTIEFCQNNGIDLNKEEVKIGRYQSLIGGTSAELQQGQVYTVMQLLYGLMLPSGNDASLALAVWCGKRFIQLDKAKSDADELSTANSSSFGQRLVKGDCYTRFIKEMSLKAQALNMNKTQYANSHGLINVNNRSTAYDIAVLSAYAMRNQIFREIVSCKSYTCTIKYYGEKLEELREEQEEISNTEPDEEEGQKNQKSGKKEKTSRPATARVDTRSLLSRSKENLKLPAPTEITIEWQNTHKLLHSKPKEYLGIKTGITTNAGPCLSSCILIEDRKFLIVVLNCGKVNLRFKETQILKKWLYKHEGLKYVKKATNLKLTKSIKSINIEGEESQGDEECLPGEDRD